MRNYKAIILITVLLAAMLGGCTKFNDRSAYPKKDFVMIYYCAGFNDLSSSIQGNLDVMKKADIPFKESKHKLLVYSHFSVSDGNFSTLTPSHLVQLSKNYGKLQADTLLTIDPTRFATDPAVMNEVLEKVQELFPGSRYGLVVSSHGTGWLPAGKYSSGNVIQFSKKRPGQTEQGPDQPEQSHGAALPLYRYNENPDEPRVKTFGAEVKMEDGKKYSQEMSIQSMAAAIPLHLDYLLFDACLMGGIEVAYELKDVADKVAFSPTEVLAAGFDYSDISSLLGDEPSIESFCKLYFDHYDKAGSYATITVVKSSELDALAQTCKKMFDKYRSGISMLNTVSGIQPYFRSGHHWFYDLEDILDKAGINADDRTELSRAINSSISYKATTAQFLEIRINTYSGLSMYLPGAGDASLNEFYKTLAWNKATNLVE